ncbi:MAG: hypothetical protein C5B51_14310 [Terriglobia bacterium]|nr:MAG: hypothetical protein C5B51_14310 [Terriglobia bacterium]
MGVAFSSEHAVFVSEGTSGRVALIDLSSGERRRVFDLNVAGYRNSFSGDLVWDGTQNVLYVADQANFRIAVIDVRSRKVLASATAGRLPMAMTLSPDRRRLYVANAGMFRYRPLPIPLSFPPFGFPSAEALTGTEAPAGQSVVQIPPIGDPTVPESNSVAVINVSDPSAPKLETFVRTGASSGLQNGFGSSPSGIIATASNVYVANAGGDSVTVIDVGNNHAELEIPLRIPGMEQQRGILPIGLAYDPKTGWLLAAEAGINAVGVIDTRTAHVLGHIPAGWFPTRLVVDRGTVFVANLRGNGSRPSARSDSNIPSTISSTPEPGSVSIYPLPSAEQLPGLTKLVMQSCGFEQRPRVAPPLPPIRHVVLIAKAGLSFDEVLGDLTTVANSPVMAAPQLAHFGSAGSASGRGDILSLHGVDLTPNHHAIARRWAFSDNFYSDSNIGLGYLWLAGVYPNAWRESLARSATSGGGSNPSLSPEDVGQSGTLWHHLVAHGITIANFGSGTNGPFLTNLPMLDPPYNVTSRTYPGLNSDVSDTGRAAQFIDEIQHRYLEGGLDLPGFVYLTLPNGKPADARRPLYPYAESFIADNDEALGRIVEYLSQTKWWQETVVFVTEASVQRGTDHIDATRTLLLLAGPWVKRSHVSHTNASFPGLIKTILALLRVPPHTLFDHAAADLTDCFDSTADDTPYHAFGADRRVYNPAELR